MAGSSLEHLLLVPLLCVFYAAAWLFFQHAIFPHRTIAAPAQGFGSRGWLSLTGAGRVFCCTLALSLATFSLLLFEITSAVSAEVRAGWWRLCLGAMLLNLHTITPGFTLFAALGEAGLGPAKAAGGAATALALFWLALYVLAPPVEHPFLSLEAGMTRVSVVGVGCLAVLSGFGAVNFPFQRLHALYGAEATKAALHAQQEQLRQTLRLIAATKRSLLAGGSGGGGRAGKTAAAQLAALEQLSAAQFLEVVAAEDAAREQARLRGTLLGRAYAALAVVAAALCAIKVVGSVRSLAFGRGDNDPVSQWVAFGQRHMASASGGGGRGGDMPGSGAAGAEGGDGGLEAWLTLASAALVGVLVLMQTRGFLMTLRSVSRAFTAGGIQPPAAVWALALAQAVGTCFTASVLLLRVNVPYRYRVAITAALGGGGGDGRGLHFAFYHDWFDALFVVSGAGTALALATLKRAPGD